MKIIETKNYITADGLAKIFDRTNHKPISDAFKNLPLDKYEMEMFETTNGKGICLSFNNDLHIKINNEDRGEFTKLFGVETHDHVNIDLKELNLK